MENCKVPGCRHYAGKECKEICTFHQIKFDIQNVVFYELNKHRNTAHPVHRDGRVKVVYK